jgi:hypothetical protein
VLKKQHITYKDAVVSSLRKNFASRRIIDRFLMTVNRGIDDQLKKLLSTVDHHEKQSNSKLGASP